MKVIHNEPEFRPFAIQIETKEEAVFMLNLLGTVSRAVEEAVVGEAVNTFKVYQKLRNILGKDAEVAILAPAEITRGEFY